MKSLRTATQILEHYCSDMDLFNYQECMLKAMRYYARLRVEKEYEKLYQEAKRNVLKQYNIK